MDSRADPGALLARALRLAGLVLLLGPGVALAQGRGGNFVLAPAPPQVSFPAPGLAEFEQGWIDSGPVTISVAPRNRQRPWTLSLAAVAGDLGGYGKPLETLLFRTDASDWQPVTTAGTQIGEGTGASAVVLYFRLLLDWMLDEPGVYGVDLTLTAATP